MKKLLLGLTVLFLTFNVFGELTKEEIKYLKEICSTVASIKQGDQQLINWINIIGLDILDQILEGDDIERRVIIKSYYQIYDKPKIVQHKAHVDSLSARAGNTLTEKQEIIDAI